MDLSKINLKALNYARPWALNIILGFGRPRYTPEQLNRKPRSELIEEIRALVFIHRGNPGVRDKWGRAKNRYTALKKKARVIVAVAEKRLTVEQADDIRLNDDVLYSLWKDEWFDIDMQFAIKGVKPSDIT